MSRCFCSCHTHPGTYGGKYCGYCTHDHRLGRFPETVRDGWEPHDSTTSQLIAPRRLSRDVIAPRRLSRDVIAPRRLSRDVIAPRRLSRDVIDAWVRLGKCEDEFSPGYTSACGEYADELDRTLGALQSALTQTVIPTR